MSGASTPAISTRDPPAPSTARVRVSEFSTRARSTGPFHLPAWSERSSPTRQNTSMMRYVLSDDFRKILIMYNYATLTRSSDECRYTAVETFGNVAEGWESNRSIRNRRGFRFVEIQLFVKVNSICADTRSWHEEPSIRSCGRHRACRLATFGRDRATDGDSSQDRVPRAGVRSLY